MGISYPLLQGQAPGYRITLAGATVFLVALLIMYCRRVQRLKTKFGSEAFTGSLRAACLISAYMDDHEAWGFAIVRTCAKSVFFLAGFQLDYQWGFVAMMLFLVVESSLDSVRILLAYRHCRSLEKVQAIAEDEARGLREDDKLLEPTNVYEDLTRPGWIAAMVFALQVNIKKSRRRLLFFIMMHYRCVSVLFCFLFQGKTKECLMFAFFLRSPKCLFVFLY